VSDHDTNLVLRGFSLYAANGKVLDSSLKKLDNLSENYRVVVSIRYIAYSRNCYQINIFTALDQNFEMFSSYEAKLSL
jgi:hypothetical protein